MINVAIVLRRGVEHVKEVRCENQEMYPYQYFFVFLFCDVFFCCCCKCNFIPFLKGRCRVRITIKETKYKESGYLTCWETMVQMKSRQRHTNVRHSAELFLEIMVGVMFTYDTHTYLSLIHI